LNENDTLKKTTSIKAKSAPSSVQSGVETRKIGTFTPDSRNANKGTEPGQQMIENSLRNVGAGRSIVLDKHGNIIGRDKTVENAGAIGPEDVIVVQTDGTKLVAVQRMDPDLAKGEGGKRIRSKWTKLACKRHLEDLERAKGKWKFRFDQYFANRVCGITRSSFTKEAVTNSLTAQTGARITSRSRLLGSYRVSVSAVAKCTHRNRQF
jgi:hypothetical protein